MRSDKRLNDPARLAALERSGLMTKPPNDRLRHLVYTAYVLLKADAAQINVLSDQLQHTAVEWPRGPARDDMDVGISGCRLTLEIAGTLVLDDVMDHPVACTMPWIGTWRGYIGTLLCYDGHPIGALCAVTTEPRQWTSADQMTLEGLAELASQAVE